MGVVAIVFVDEIDLFTDDILGDDTALCDDSLNDEQNRRLIRLLIDMVWWGGTNTTNSIKQAHK